MMEPGDVTEIQLSKVKSGFIFIGGIALVVLSVWVFNLDDGKSHYHTHHKLPLNVFLSGIVCIILGALSAIVGLFKLFSNNPGLVLNEKGFLNNSNDNSFGWIPWEEVTGFKVIRPNRSRVRMLMVYVSNPARYARRGNMFKRMMNYIGTETDGTPISIASVMLAIDFDELAQLFETYYSRYQRSQQRKLPKDEDDEYVLWHVE